MFVTCWSQLAKEFSNVGQTLATCWLIVCQISPDVVNLLRFRCNWLIASSCWYFIWSYMLYQLKMYTSQKTPRLRSQKNIILCYILIYWFSRIHSLTACLRRARRRARRAEVSAALLVAEEADATARLATLAALGVASVEFLWTPKSYKFPI